MQDLIDQILTPEVRMVLYLLVVCVVMLYVLSIVYVIRDAQRRGAEPWWMWAIISVIPIVGLLAYVILRPSSYLIDREEQDLDIALREHQLSHYGICPKCGKGRMLERKSSKGRIYYGCERYPDCDFMTWDMPVPTKCPKCGSTMFRKGSKLYCAKEGCGYEMPVPKKD